MKTMIQTSWKGLIPVILIILALSVSFHSCQKDEISLQKDVMFKAAVIPFENPTLYWGHVQFIRTTGKPVTETITISGDDLEYFAGCLHLKVKNGDGVMHLADNAVIKIDGVQMVFPGDFESSPLLITREICGKTGDFTLEIQLRGTPGSFVEVWIEGVLKPGFAIVDEEGGQITSEDGLLSITFPESSVSHRTVFNVTLTDYPTLENFNEEFKGAAYLLEPHGFLFQEPVIIKLQYNPELFSVEENIRVLHWFLPQENHEIIHPVIDKDKKEISFAIDHFSGVATYETAEIGNFFSVGSEKHLLNMGYNVWFSELDCGNRDIYAHGIYLTSDIVVRKFDITSGGKGLLPAGKGDIVIFNLFNKNAALIPGKYTFVDKVDCSGLVTDGDITYTMSETDKLVTAVKEMNDPTSYDLNVDLEIDWANVDFNNPSDEVMNKYMNYINSRIGIKEGYVNVEKENNSYTITINCTDNNGVKITGSYSGQLTSISFAI